jgi:hypothetical protein
MNDFEYDLLFGGIFGIFIAVGIVLLILGPKRIGTSSFEEASQEVKERSHSWVVSLIGVVLANIVLWFWLGLTVPMRSMLFMLLGLNLYAGVVVLVEYQSYHLSRKHVAEQQRLQKHQGGEEPSLEK